MNKLINWFKQSNRYKHLILGLQITTFYILLLGLLFNNEELSTKIEIVSVANLSNFTHMCAVEYKDKLAGNKFDWNDIIAGTVPVLLISILTMLIKIFLF